jgi:hypothetical protein
MGVEWRLLAAVVIIDEDEVARERAREVALRGVE